MATKGTDNIKFFDYGKSFILTENNEENTPRLLVEAKCTVGKENYYLCAPCKGEHTFAERNLFEQSAFEFTPIINEKEVLIFRKFGFYNAGELNEYKKVYTSGDIWGDKKIPIKEVGVKQLLNTPKKIIATVKSGIPIMGRIVLKSKDGKKSATIDFPIKTININGTAWQVDTGIIPIPDLEEESPHPIYLFDLGYIAFNNFDFVEFIARDLYKLTNDYWIIHACKIKRVDNPEIYLYSL